MSSKSEAISAIVLAGGRAHREVAGFKVPTMALYHKSCLVKIEGILKSKSEDWSLQSLLKAVTTKVVPEESIKLVDPKLRCFTNLNTPEDWQRLNRWILLH